MAVIKCSVGEMQKGHFYSFGYNLTPQKAVVLNGRVVTVDGVNDGQGYIYGVTEPFEVKSAIEERLNVICRTTSDSNPRRFLIVKSEEMLVTEVSKSDARAWGRLR